MSPVFFATPSDFRKWLAKNHTKETELLVGFYKVGSGKPSINWDESVTEALCYGWIDGIRRSIDDTSYCIRFTPRKPTSIWSAINIRKIEALTKQGLMQPAGIAAYQKRKDHKSKIYSYETEPVQLDAASEKKFKANKKAWQWYTNQAPSYQKSCTYWIMSAKQETTKANRLKQLIADSEQEKKLKQYSYTKKK